MSAYWNRYISLLLPSKQMTTSVCMSLLLICDAINDVTQKKRTETLPYSGEMSRNKRLESEMTYGCEHFLGACEFKVPPPQDDLVLWKQTSFCTPSFKRQEQQWGVCTYCGSDFLHYLLYSAFKVKEVETTQQSIVRWNFWPLKGNVLIM